VSSGMRALLGESEILPPGGATLPQPYCGGSRTASITWIMPFAQFTFGLTIFAPLTVRVAPLARK